MTIIAIGAGAIAAITAYRKRQAADPQGVGDKVARIRQSTSVVLAIADAVWSVLDALIFLVKPRGGGGNQVRRFGQAAGDVVEA